MAVAAGDDKQKTAVREHPRKRGLGPRDVDVCGWEQDGRCQRCLRRTDEMAAKTVVRVPLVEGYFSKLRRAQGQRGLQVAPGAPAKACLAVPRKAFDLAGLHLALQ